MFQLESAEYVRVHYQILSHLLSLAHLIFAFKEDRPGVRSGNKKLSIDCRGITGKYIRRING